MRLKASIGNLLQDEDGSFMGTAIFLAIIVGILAIGVIDGSSCLYANNAAADVSQEAANDAFVDYQLYRNDVRAANVAATHCEEKGLVFIGFRINTFEGHTFDVTCSKDAKTYVFKHLPVLKELIHQEQTRTSTGTT